MEGYNMFWDEKDIALLMTLLLKRMRVQAQNSSQRPHALQRLLTVKDAAAYLGRTVPALERLIFRKEIPVVRVGRRVRLDVKELDRWIERNSTTQRSTWHTCRPREKPDG